MAWCAFGGYIIGKKRGKGAQYALLAVPISLVSYVAAYYIAGQLA
jgi:hypothetical protein